MTMAAITGTAALDAAVSCCPLLLIGLFLGGLFVG